MQSAAMSVSQKVIGTVPCTCWYLSRSRWNSLNTGLADETQPSRKRNCICSALLHTNKQVYCKACFTQWKKVFFIYSSVTCDIFPLWTIKGVLRFLSTVLMYRNSHKVDQHVHTLNILQQHMCTFKFMGALLSCLHSTKHSLPINTWPKIELYNSIIIIQFLAGNISIFQVAGAFQYILHDPDIYFHVHFLTQSSHSCTFSHMLIYAV